MIRIIALCAAGAMLFACKHSEKTELLASGHTEAVRLETSQSDTVTTRTEGPERITVMVFAPPEEEGSAPTRRAEPSKQDGGSDATQLGTVLRLGNLPPHGALLKATIIERGPVLTESHVAAKDAITATAATSSVSKAVHEEKSAPAGCLLGGSLLAWAVPLVLAALAWKFRKVWWP